MNVLLRCQLDDDALIALVDSACREVAARSSRRPVDGSLAAEIVDRRLATHTDVASVLAETQTSSDRSALLEPLRAALRRETKGLLSLGTHGVDNEAGELLLRDIDEVLSPNSIDCLMMAAGQSVAVAQQVLSEALTTILGRSGMQVELDSTAPTMD